MANKVTCRVCGKELAYSVLTRHIKDVHNLTPEEYYRRYVVEDESAGYCKVCGKPTKFYSIKKGFRKTCSEECLHILLREKDAEKRKGKPNTCADCKHFVLKFFPNEAYMRLYNVTNASPPTTLHVCLRRYCVRRGSDKACEHFERKPV